MEGKHGKTNVLNATLNADETTPHLVAYVVPLNAAGCLSAKDFLGEKDKTTQLQKDFHAAVGTRFGLEHGILGSPAKHQAVRRFYAQHDRAHLLAYRNKHDIFQEYLPLFVKYQHIPSTQDYGEPVLVWLS